MRVTLAFVCLLFGPIGSFGTAAAAPFEKTPVPPRAFDGIRAGMTLAEASRALAGYQPDDAYRDAASRKRLVKDAGDGAKYYVLVTGETIARIGIEAPQSGLEARLTRLWGRPSRLTNLANESIMSWRGPTWRIDLSCRGALCRMAFHQPLTPAFFGAGVSPPGPLAALRVGMSRDELVKLAPQYASGADVPAGIEDMRVTVDVAKSGVVRSVAIAGLPANTREIVTQAWGNPTETDRGAMWIDRERGWRAHYNADLQVLELTGHLSAARLLGTGPGIAGLPRPVLGATQDQLAAAYPTLQIEPKAAHIALPPIENATHPTLVSVRIDAKSRRVTKLAVVLPYASRAERDELLTLLQSKWGKPAKRSTKVLAFPAGKQLGIEAEDLGTGVQLRLQIQQ